MSWNHRILRTTVEMGGKEYPMYALHEVFYDDAGKPGSWTAEPVAIVGDTLKETMEVYAQMSNAFMKPVLAVVDDKLVETDEELVPA